MANDKWRMTRRERRKLTRRRPDQPSISTHREWRRLHPNKTQRSR
jgi:hypothetical protein